MTPTVSIERALGDPGLFGGAIGDLSTWSMWIAVLKAAFGLPLTADELARFASVAGNRAPPSRLVQSLWCVAGRGSGKSRMAAAAACFIATCIDYANRLARGEVGTVMCLAPTKAQADIVFGYCKGFLEGSPVLHSLVENVT